MCSCEDKLNRKRAHFWSQSVVQKRLVLKLTSRPLTINPDGLNIREETY